MAFLSWHWLIAFNTYDRYIHTLVPFLLILATHILTSLPKQLLFAVLLIPLLILPSTLHTLRATTDDSTGIDHLANYLNTELSGEIIYDHWLGWQLSYYLGNNPHVIVLYMPLPDDLAVDMAAQSYPRYLVAPSPQIAAPWLAALDHVHLHTTLIKVDNFVIYKIWPYQPSSLYILLDPMCWGNR